MAGLTGYPLPHPTPYRGGEASTLVMPLQPVDAVCMPCDALQRVCPQLPDHFVLQLVVDPDRRVTACTVRPGWVRWKGRK